MARTEIKAISTEEAYKRITSLHSRAAKKGRTLSVQMEMESPTDTIDTADDHGYDAFGRVMEFTGVVTRSNPSAGMHATEIGELMAGTHIMPNGEPIGREQGRAIAMIWCERRWRERKYGEKANTRAMFTADDDPAGSMLRPFAEAATIRDVQNNPAQVNLSQIVAQETMIEGDAFKSVYVDEDSIGTFDYKRVLEATDIPTVDLRTHEEQIRLFKRGRAINWSYEAARNMRLDKFGKIVDKMAYDVEAGKLAQALGVLIAGDGNPNTAATVDNLTAMDASLTAGDPISAKAWRRWYHQWYGAYNLNTVFANVDEIVELETLPLDLTHGFLAQAGALGNGITSVLGSIYDLRGNAPSAPSVGVAPVPAGIIAAGKYLGFDRNYALERISQIGATVSEADNFIGNQTNLLTFTDVDGFATFFPKATRILDTNA